MGQAGRRCGFFFHQAHACQDLFGTLHHNIVGRSQKIQYFLLVGKNRDLDILENRHAVEYIDDLERTAEPHVTDAVRGHSGDIRALEHHFAAVWLELPGDEVEQRGFARAVGSDDRHDISFFNQEIGIKNSHKSVQRFLK